MSSDATVPVGTMHVNSVGQLSRLENAISEGSHIQPSLWDLDLEEEKSGKSYKQSVGVKFRLWS